MVAAFGCCLEFVIVVAALASALMSCFNILGCDVLLPRLRSLFGCDVCCYACYCCEMFVAESALRRGSDVAAVVAVALKLRFCF